MRIRKPTGENLAEAMSRLHLLLTNSKDGVPQGPRPDQALAALNFGGIRNKRL